MLQKVIPILHHEPTERYVILTYGEVRKINDYGSILKACRERVGLSQEDMAFEMNRDQGCISRIESGRKKIELSEAINWLQITQAPEVAVAFFLGVDGITIMQQVVEMLGSTITTILLGGIL